MIEWFGDYPSTIDQRKDSIHVPKQCAKDILRHHVDDELLNTIELSKTINRTPDKANPFHEPHYILLNLAIGGTNGGDPSPTEFPSRFEIDYVRIYQNASNQ